MTSFRREPIRSFVAWVSGEAWEPSARPTLPDSWHEARLGALTVRWVTRSASHDERGVEAHALALVIGDGSELSASADACIAAGVPLRSGSDGRSIELHTSIVGLPPIFLYRTRGVTAITSDIHLLEHVPGVRLELDERGVIELARIGHPVAHRTLFRDLSLAPSASRIVLHDDGTLAIESAWSLPDAAPLSRPDFIEAQIAAFTESVRNLDLSRSFLSLTAGLDTRTVFAALAQQGRLVPTATMTGPKRSLDARAALELSRAYSVPHHAVTFDERFVGSLPRYIETASRLSGGLASVDQAPEVFFYDTLDGGFSARLSGNLGNQVGRGGTEGVSTRGADTGILASDTRAAGADEQGHWLLDHMHRAESERLEFILKNEIVFTLVNNYPIGNHYAAQQTPYASRALIETLARRPRDGAGPSGSRLRMRLRDLSHRFLGEPESRSFQRTLLRRANGFAARYPINWGWRASGGVSPKGAVLGAATLVGMYARARGLDDGLLRKPMQWTGLPALHDFRESRRWLREDLRDYTRDTLAADAGGLFDRARLARVLDEHFAGARDHYQTIVFALDVALAHRNFCGAARPAEMELVR